MLRRKAFTLVELLVVIGIIAVLVGILLPSLQAARRQANAVKCAASLKEVGNCFTFYAMDSKGYYPPALMNMATGKTYVVEGTSYPTSGYGVYWFNFLNKYVSKTKIGLNASNATDAVDARTRSILWGCPSWEGYNSTSIGGYNRLQIGYGMNPFPSFTAGTDPAPASPIINGVASYQNAVIANWPNIYPATPTQSGDFQKQKAWGKDGALKCLVADSLFWEVEAEKVPDSGALIGQADISNTTAAGNWAFAAANTLTDCYRHGKYPLKDTNGFSYRVDGGKVGFNMLFGDGHVAEMTDRPSAFKALRMRFPG